MFSPSEKDGQSVFKSWEKEALSSSSTATITSGFHFRNLSFSLTYVKEDESPLFPFRQPVRSFQSIELCREAIGGGGSVEVKGALELNGRNLAFEGVAGERRLFSGSKRCFYSELVDASSLPLLLRFFLLELCSPWGRNLNRGQQFRTNVSPSPQREPSLNRRRRRRRHLRHAALRAAPGAPDDGSNSGREPEPALQPYDTVTPADARKRSCRLRQKSRNCFYTEHTQFIAHLFPLVFFQRRPSSSSSSSSSCDPHPYLRVPVRATVASALFTVPYCAIGILVGATPNSNFEGEVLTILAAILMVSVRAPLTVAITYRHDQVRMKRKSSSKGNFVFKGCTSKFLPRPTYLLSTFPLRRRKKVLLSPKGRIEKRKPFLASPREVGKE